MIVQDVMTHDPTTVHPATSAKEALTLLARLRITSMPVVDEDGQLLGVVSEADLIRDTVAPDPRVQERPVPLDPLFAPRTVDEVYSRHALATQVHDDLARAVDLMTSTAVKSLPVVDAAGRLVGIVSRSDVVRLLARSDVSIAGDVDGLLQSLGHPDWLVEVEDGVVWVTGPDAEADRSLAHVVAHTVPGVIEVRIR